MSEVKRPGRGVRLTPAERHAYHHVVIAERREAWEKAPKRTGLDKSRRRELDKRAWHTLKAHVIGEHGIRRSWLGKTWADLAGAHDQAHAEERA